jgi:hypothetical protein
MSTEHNTKTPSLQTGLFALLSILLRADGTSVSNGEATKEVGPSADHGANVNADGRHVCTSSPDGTGRTAPAIHLAQGLEKNYEGEKDSKATSSLRASAATRHVEPIGRRRSRGGRSVGSRAAYVVGVATAACLAFTANAFTGTPPEAPVTDAVTVNTGTSVTFNGTVNPGVAPQGGVYQFLYKKVSNGAGCEGESVTVGGAVAGLGPEPETEPAAVEPDTEYTVCLAATNSSSEATVGNAVVFKSKVASPTVSDVASTDVASTSVTLHATLNPEGGETTYTFEYAPSGGGFKPVVEPNGKGSGSVPEGTTGVPLEVHVQEGLSANTAYEFRLVVGNSAAQGVDSESVTFTTQGTFTEFKLPDDRGYEMVTPVHKQGAQFKAGSGEGAAIRAAASGDGIADVATLPSEDAPEGNADALVSVLSSRGGSGWSSRVIAAPHPIPGPAREDQEEYITFSEDLSRAVVEPPGLGVEKLSPQASEPTPYLHTLSLNENPTEPCTAPYTSTASCYAPLVSPTDDTHTPLLPFGELTTNGFCEEVFRCGPRVRGGTPNLGHLVLSSQVPLTTTPAPTGTRGVERQPDLYEYTAGQGQLQLLSILPGQTEGSPNLELA